MSDHEFTLVFVLRFADADARRAMPSAVLMEASPDLVGLTDVAALLDVSRQNVRKLILAGGTPAPVPVHEGKPTIWRLANVLGWLRDVKDHPVSENLLELARATMQVNLAVGPLDADQAVQRELRELIAQGDARRVGY